MWRCKVLLLFTLIYVRGAADASCEPKWNSGWCFCKEQEFQVTVLNLSTQSQRHIQSHTSAHLPTARTVTSPWWLRRCSALRADGFLISGHFFWLQRMQMFLWPLAPPMVCRWLQVCLAAPAGAPGDKGVIGGVGVPGEIGVRGGLRKKNPTLVTLLSFLLQQ